MRIINKFVLDTNIIISNLWSGKARDVVNLWRDKKVDLVVSEDIIKEYLEVLGRFIADDVLKEWAEIFTDETMVTIVKPSCHFEVVKNDPDDNKFLDCAVEGGADCIVSGDKHLMGIKKFKDIEILNCEKLLKRFENYND